MLKVNEIFRSIQGEGAFVGHAMTFVRLSGCNLKCKFCDTTHMACEEYSEEEIATEVSKYFVPDYLLNRVCLTGGEPLMQDITQLLKLLNGTCVLHLETNGTFPVPLEFDWIACSPKSTLPSYARFDEIKWLVGDGVELWKTEVEKVPPHITQHLQPVWDKNYQRNLDTAFNEVLKNPKLHLSAQVHKYLKVR